MGETIETVLRTIMSVNQQSIYWVVSDLCDEYRICQAKTVRIVLAEQFDPLFELASFLMKTPTPRPKILHNKIYCKSTKN